MRVLEIKKKSTEKNLDFYIDRRKQSRPTNSEARSGNASAPRFPFVPNTLTPAGLNRLPPDWTAQNQPKAFL
ncbi:hypothetical protein TNCV_1217931 [Trichonephila clavipes]|nr:hypothetical protein TNCV_1217931 [Trichonephila clavipes]